MARVHHGQRPSEAIRRTAGAQRRPMARWLTVLDAFARARTSGASATSPRTPASRAARSTGWSTRWHAWACSPRHRRRPIPGRPGAGAPGRAARRSGSTSGAWRGPILERGRGELDETLVLALYSPVASPVLGRGRGRDRAIPSATSGSRSASGATSTPARAARASSRSCPTTERDAILARCPIRCPGRRPVSQGDAARRAGACARERGTWSAMASGSRGGGRRRRPSATRPGGSSATSSAGRTTAPTGQGGRAASRIKSGADELSRRLGWPAAEPPGAPARRSCTRCTL